MLIKECQFESRLRSLIDTAIRALLKPEFCATTLKTVPLNVVLSLSIASDLLCKFYHFFKHLKRNNDTNTHVVYSLPLTLILQLHRPAVLHNESPPRTGRPSSKNERFSVIFLLILGVLSFVASAYRVVDTNVSGYTKNVPLPLGKRNLYITGQVVSNTLLLAALAMPSIRVLVRRRRRRGEVTLFEQSDETPAKARKNSLDGVETMRLRGAFGMDDTVDIEMPELAMVKGCEKDLRFGIKSGVRP